jgi:uncharacterized protein (DUF362 family)
MIKNKVKQISSAMILLSIIATLTLYMSECTTTGIPTDYAPIHLERSRVSIIQSDAENAEDISYSEIQRMVRESVNLVGGLKSLISDGDTVVLKPNLVSITDYTLPGWKGKPLSVEVNGATTDYRVIKAVVELVREINPSGTVYVMEGSSIPTEKAFEHFNYNHESIPGVDAFLALEKDSGKFGDRESPGLVKVSLPEGLLTDTYYYNKKYYEADVLISIPCLKNHWSAIVTGSIKNLSIGATPGNVYGISANSPGRNNMVNHSTLALHYWLHDYFLGRPADFVIMDGLQGIQNGPTPSAAISGATDIKDDQMNMRLIMAGKDSVAVDTIESIIMGWNPLSVPYLRLLNTSRVGNIDTAYIDVTGKSVDMVRKVFKGRVTNTGASGSIIRDTEAPEISIISAKLEKGSLKVNLESDPDLHFVKFLLNNTPLNPVITKDFHAIQIDLDDSLKKAKDLTIEAYDMYLNVYRQTIKLPYVSEGSYIAKKTNSPPVIDGSGDDPCWAGDTWYPLSELWLGKIPTAEDFSGRFKITWTEEKLYVLAEITDDILRDVHPDPLVDYYKDDCIEILIDEDGSGGTHTHNYNAFIYHVSLQFDAVDLGKDGQPHLFNDHLKIARTDRGTLSTWEFEVTVYDDTYVYNGENQPVRLLPGKRMGFAMAYCDNDEMEDRESFIGSEKIKGGNKNRAWMDAGLFSSLSLIE